MAAAAWTSCTSRRSICCRFSNCRKAVFDTQVAFNLLDRLGDKALPTLASVESRIVRHFRGIVQDKLNVPR